MSFLPKSSQIAFSLEDLGLEFVLHIDLSLNYLFLIFLDVGPVIRAFMVMKYTLTIKVPLYE